MDLGLKCVKEGSGDGAVVFIHGILSDGERCWKHPNGSYWPDLLAKADPRGILRIFVYTYESNIFSADYNLLDVVDDLRQRLRDAALENLPRIVFVCHSMGGIVARRYLVRRQLDSTGSTTFGLFLVASPSLGSEWANWLRPIAESFQHSQADALRFSKNNSWLDTLDRDFRDLKESGRLALHGRELIEDKFIVLNRFFLLPKVVERISGARYFGEALKIAGSDHSTIAKPKDDDALQHKALVEFIGNVLPGFGAHLQPHVRDPKPEAALFDVGGPRTNAKRSTPDLATTAPEGTYVDRETKLMWSKEDNGKELEWNEAKEYARELSLGGYNDWRLPTIEELEDLYAPGIEGVCKIRKPFRLSTALIWSSTKFGPGSGWFFNFENGVRLYHIHGAARNPALCVRDAEE